MVHKLFIERYPIEMLFGFWGCFSNLDIELFSNNWHAEQIPYVLTIRPATSLLGRSGRSVVVVCYQLRPIQTHRNRREGYLALPFHVQRRRNDGRWVMF
jgi:hypothetical protein